MKINLISGSEQGGEKMVDIDPNFRPKSGSEI